MVSTRVTYWWIFRLIFVVFCLYLTGDAFYRWDGFRYYATFSEFLPALALVTVLWSIVAGLTALLIWLTGTAIEWLFHRIGWKVKITHLLLFIVFFVLLGAAALFGKRFIWLIVQTDKEILFFCVTLAAIFLTWLFRNKSGRWMSVIQEHITPLVWLFGILLVLSVPLAAYHTWGKQTDKVISPPAHSSSIADGSRPNIILVTFDTLTARDMSAYGYRRSTTPFINEWAKEASLFTRLHADSNITTPTTATLMTGKRPWTHQTYHIEGSRPLRNNIENLPLVLKNNGYYNMAFVANPKASVKKLGISESFEIAPLPSTFSTPVSLFGTIDKLLYRLFGDKIRLHDWIVKEDFILRRLVDLIFRNFSKTLVPPKNAFNRFLEAVDNNRSMPFFAWIHLMPPHAPYLPPEPYMGMFDSSSELRTFKSQLKILKKRYFSQEMQPTIDTLRTRYDEFIRYCDKQFEDFITQLTSINKLKNTVIILSSDHGESFEHNYLKHSGPYLYEQMTHVPLIIKEPLQTEERIINVLIEQIDIAPTILDLADIPAPSWLEGRSLVPLMRGKSLSSRAVFSMALEKNFSRGQHPITKGTIAVWEGDYKLIYYLNKEKPLLFNLKQDPGELNNLFDEEPEIGRRLLILIRDNLKKANEKISRGK